MSNRPQRTVSGTNDRHSPHRRRLLPASVIAMGCLVAATACGSGRAAPSTSPTTRSTNAYSQLLTFSECMRRNEMPPQIFPNPVTQRPANPGQEPVTRDSTAQHALTVPVAALVPEASGAYHVDVAGSGNVPVSLGSFDAGTGRVQVTGSLTAGQEVVTRYTLVIDHGGAFLAIPQLWHLQSRAFRNAAATCGAARLDLGLPAPNSAQPSARESGPGKVADT